MSTTLQHPSPATLPLVSILIPAYKPRWFEEALCSALAQDYANTEILVFDNCPTDDIRLICARYPQVHYQRNPNLGLQNLIDLAIASRGVYLKFLFDDDLLEAQCVRELVAALAQTPQACLAIAQSWLINEVGARVALRELRGGTERLQRLDGNEVCLQLARDCQNFIGEFPSVLFDGAWVRENPERLCVGECAGGARYRGLVNIIGFINASAGRPVAFVPLPLSAFRQDRDANSNADKNPDFIAVITEWCRVIDEVQQRGLLSADEELLAKNNYNHHAVGCISRYPALTGQIEATLFTQTSLHAEQDYAHYEALLAAGERAAATDHLLALAARNSSDWKVYAALAAFAEDSADEKLALSYYAKAKLLHPRPHLADLDYARLLVKRQMSTLALSHLRPYQQCFPDDLAAHALIATCIAQEAQRDYLYWQGQRCTGGLSASDYQGRVAKLWKHQPLVEFIMVLKAGQEAWLADSIDSLLEQHYTGWRLAVFATSPAPNGQFNATQAGMRWIECAAGAATTSALNAHLLQSRADWIAFFDCGTRFAPALLLNVGDYAALHPEWQLIYSDDDVLDAEGTRQCPRFKPDFNLELLRASDYIGSLLVKRDALLAAGGVAQLPGAENLDIILRIADQQADMRANTAIGHIPDVLYHQPAALQSLPISPDAEEAAATALREHLQRRGIDAQVGPGLLPGTRRVLYRHTQTPLVSIIIPTRNRVDLFGACVESLLKLTRYPHWELIVVDNDSDDPQQSAYYAALCSSLPEQVRILNHPGPFNYAAMNNAAAQVARGDYLLLLNNDTACIHDDWLDALLAQAQRPEVGVVGARLLYPDSLKIQSAGSIVGMADAAAHVFIHAAHDASSYLQRAELDQEYSAVTGACLMVRTALYQAVGGLDEVAFKALCNDTDLCLKVRQSGYLVIYTPFATLLHVHSASLGTVLSAADRQAKVAAFTQENFTFKKRWQTWLIHDPAWNRNLSLASTTPVVEAELVPSWNPDFHDRLRILSLPGRAPGVKEYRSQGPLHVLHAAERVHYTQARCWLGGTERTPYAAELLRMAPDTLLVHTPVNDEPYMSWFDFAQRDSEILRVYSLDDLITDLPLDNPARPHLPEAAVKVRLAQGLAVAHRLIVSTEPLAELCRPLIEDIRLLPNALDAQLWDGLQAQRRRGKKLRVGWAGAQQHAGDLRFLREVVEATQQEVDWVFFGMRPEGVPEDACETHGFVFDLADYRAKLASLDLDLALAPLEMHPFNEAKSNLRLLEYGILGWPVICTDIFPFQTRNPPVLRLPNVARQWIVAIRERIGAYDQLAREGDALRAWVRQHYLLEQHLDAWYSALLR